MNDPNSFKTNLKRAALYKDRWSSHALNPGIVEISDRLSAEELAEYDIFKPYSAKFLEKISPDIAVVTWKKGALLFEEGTYIDLAFYVIEGHVEASLTVDHKTGNRPIFNLPKDLDKQVAKSSPNATVFLDMVALSKETLRQSETKNITMLSTMDFNLPHDTGANLGSGELFGEIGALSGWPQSVTARTASDCTLIQIRLPALRLMKNKSPELKTRLDQLYRERSLVSQLKSTPLLADLGTDLLHEVALKAELVSLKPDEVLVSQGSEADALYMVRSGFVKLEQGFGTGQLVVSYLSKGMTLGETELLITDLKGRQSSAVSVEYAELIKIPKPVVQTLLAEAPGFEEQLWRSAGEKVRAAGYSKHNMGHSEFTQTALDKGLVQGTSVLVIDLDTCTRCDDCVRACAATHGGRPRFVREGSKIENLLIPKSCYHCRDPVCLVGCPTGAIHRGGGSSEVITIDGDICIGCSTCANNCPYDAIVMHDMGENWPRDMIPTALRDTPRLQASKCDLCRDTGHEPACVTNCPQGCAARLNSLDDFERLFKGG